MSIHTHKSCRRLLRRFIRTRKGTTAVEFSFIAMPFFLVILGTLEIAVTHMTRASVGNAMETTSRQVMTGSAGCMSAGDFISDMCSRIKMTNSAKCSENLKVDMRELTSFSDDVGADNISFEARRNVMEQGQGSSIMLLRTFYRKKVMIPLLSEALGGEDGEIIMVTNVAFRNEPFSAAQGCTPNAAS